MTIEQTNETKNGNFKAVDNDVEAGLMTYTGQETTSLLLTIPK